MTETKKKTLWAELRRIAKAVRAEYGEEAYARAVEGEPSLHDGLSPYEAFNFTTLDADAARAAYSAYKKLLDASPAKADATTRKAVMQQAMTTRAALRSNHRSASTAFWSATLPGAAFSTCAAFSAALALSRSAFDWCQADSHVSLRLA